MFGGRLISKSRKTVPGSYRQLAWSDTWQDSIDIDFDGDLSDPQVQKAIKDAFYASQECQKAQSLYGQLRASHADSVSHIDVEKRQLIINGGCQLAD